MKIAHISCLLYGKLHLSHQVLNCFIIFHTNQWPVKAPQVTDKVVTHSYFFQFISLSIRCTFCSPEYDTLKTPFPWIWTIFSAWYWNYTVKCANAILLELRQKKYHLSNPIWSKLSWPCCPWYDSSADAMEIRGLME